MSTGFERMEPYPQWLRRRFKSISLKDAFRLVSRSKIIAPIPTEIDLTLVLGEGDRLLIEPYRDEEGRPRLGYYFLWKEEYPAEEEILYHPKKEDFSGRTEEPFGPRDRIRKVA